MYTIFVTKAIVEHLTFYKTFAQPVAIWAVIQFWSKSETAQKQFLLHV